MKIINIMVGGMHFVENTELHISDISISKLTTIDMSFYGASKRIGEEYKVTVFSFM